MGIPNRMRDYGERDVPAERQQCPQKIEFKDPKGRWWIKETSEKRGERIKKFIKNRD